MYSNTLTQLAGRGYVVLAVSPAIPTSDLLRDGPVPRDKGGGLTGEVDKMFETLEWVSGRCGTFVLLYLIILSDLVVSKFFTEATSKDCSLLAAVYCFS